MKFLKNIFFLLLIINFYSCLLNCPKPFYTYKQKINFSNVSLKTNGIFVSVNDHGSFYFYSNGKVWGSVRPNNDFWENPEEILQNDRVGLRNNNHELWGDYLIREDSTIIIQTFGNCQECVCRRMVLEQTGKILTDTTLIIYSMYAYDTKDTIVRSDNIFKYYPTNIKQDSSLVWFNNKKWYKKNLYELRR